MGKKSREKGKRGERELSKLLRNYGYEARRGQQYCGANGDADVVGLPGLHIECKWVEDLNLSDAMGQSERDAKQGEIPVVIHKKNRHPWLTTMSAINFVNMVAETSLFHSFPNVLITIPLYDFLKIYDGYIGEAGGGNEG